MTQRQLTCIGCPMGCQLTATIESYARKECVAPARTVTGTVRCTGGAAPVVSVRTAGEVPKEKVFDVARALNTAVAHLPIHPGDVIIADVCGTGINVVATKSAK